MGEIKLRKQLRDHLKDLYREGYGKPKHDIKDVHNASPYIHSYRTYKTYDQQLSHFLDWCKSEGITEQAEARSTVEKYLQGLIDQNLSAWTVSTATAALAKTFDCSMTDFEIDRPKRERLSVRRSRLAVEHDKHVSQYANNTLIEFCRSCGLRRHELEALRGSNLIEKNGELVIHTKGKGGRPRDVEIIGDRAQTVRLMKQAGDNLVFETVHSKLDVHSLRAQYACALYRKYARPLDQVPYKERYFCRGDKAGIVYDKKAMKIVSEAMGHSRIDVIAISYLHGL